MYQRPFLDDRGVKSGTASEKRAILTSWASDASAIASCPALRAPAGLRAPVTIDEILEALCELDDGLAIRQAKSPAFNVKDHGGRQSR